MNDDLKDYIKNMDDSEYESMKSMRETINRIIEQPIMFINSVREAEKGVSQMKELSEEQREKLNIQGDGIINIIFCNLLLNENINDNQYVRVDRALNRIESLKKELAKIDKHNMEYGFNIFDKIKRD